MNTLYLVDASPFIFRAWFGMPNNFFDDARRPLNALYGFGLFIRDWFKRYQPAHAVFCFDESLETGFRHTLYPAYKANRALPDDALAYQLHSCRQLAEAVGLCCVASERYEADDLIGTLAVKALNMGWDVVILSTDKDLSQLVSEQCHIDPFYKPERLDLAGFRQSYGFEPSLLADYLALAGDAVDNIPGVTGVGKKTAQALVQTFGGLEQIYQQLESGVSIAGLRGFESIKRKLLAEKDNAYLFRQLTRIYCDAELFDEAQSWLIQEVDNPPLRQALERWSMEKRLQSLLALWA